MLVEGHLTHDASGGGRDVSDCDTLRLHSAADVATWQPDLNYGRSWDPTATRCCTCFDFRSLIRPTQF